MYLVQMDGDDEVWLPSLCARLLELFYDDAADVEAYTQQIGELMLSFPRPGISIAVDLPMRKDIQTVVDELNELVLAEGGRIYLTKDTVSRADHFRAMETRLDRFLEERRRWDPETRIRSAQSVRLFGDSA